MKKIQLIFAISIIAALLSCKTEKDKEKYTTKMIPDNNGYTYETIVNDPTKLRLYTLKNGLKVYLSKNNDEPKIQTYIAVRAGSNYDPKETTGLAHYLEHMLFKGTDKFGTSNWIKEKEYLSKISSLYEAHRAEKDTLKKNAIFKKIDSISLVASNYSIANEYDKMITIIGSEGNNAHTWVEETVYHNKIPTNELKKWLKLESNRFSKLVLRLFHTELEAVYEEFNMALDDDNDKMFTALLDGLFPTHPYGQQTTIGTSEHLKNPSMVAIHNYFNKYYVPNNMAMVLVGDLDFDKTIKLVDATFGKLEKKEVHHPKLPVEEPITSPVVKEVFGPTAETISLAFRAGGKGTKDEKMIMLIDMMLSNSKAGLFDLNLNQQQKVQNAVSYTSFFTEYGLHAMDGTPKDGQSLDEVKDLILGQIDKIKNGEFDEWLLDAVINDLKLRELKRFDNATSLASMYYNAFIHHQDWKNRIALLDELKKITKQEVVEFAKQFYKDNYVVVYKRKGKDKNIVKVKNPGITPVKVNRETQSEFVNEFIAEKSEELEPLFIDYKKEIKKERLASTIEVAYVKNKSNDLFSLYFIFDMGKDHNKKLPLAVDYLNYIGTDQLSPKEVKKEFYKLGVSYAVWADKDKSYVYLSGLEENLTKGVELLENLWTNAEPNQEAYDKYIAKILKDRADEKTDKDNILWDGLLNYGKYGENSPLREIYNADELHTINPVDLVTIIKDLKNYKQRIFYYGKTIDEAMNALNKFHKVPNKLKEYPKPVMYTKKETGGKVYFTDYDMVQSELLFLGKGDEFDARKLALSRVFNAYFGDGMASIVFQEIRESKSLAYSAFATYSNARKKGQPNYVYAYVGTQTNKLSSAVDAMLELMNTMPKSEKLFKAAKESVLKNIAAERITKSAIFWKYERLKNRGIDNDNREEIYNEVKKITWNDLSKFFEEAIKGTNYTTLVIGNKKDLNVDALKKLGKITELDVDYLFNYKTTTVKQ